MIIGLNHVAILVKDIEASITFYRDIIGLKIIPRPNFDFQGAWFEVGQQQLHLIEENHEKAYVKISYPRGNHFAIQVSSYKEVEASLKAKGATFMPPKKRPDGAIQIFIQDPDGHYLELVELI